jgi:hypothetical protein
MDKITVLIDNKGGSGRPKLRFGMVQNACKVESRDRS